MPRSAGVGRTNRLLAALVVICALQFLGMAVAGAWGYSQYKKGAESLKSYGEMAVRASDKLDNLSISAADNLSKIQPFLLKAQALADRLNDTSFASLFDSLSRAEAALAALNLSNLDEGIMALQNVTRGLEALNMSELQNAVNALKDVTDNLQSLSTAIHGNMVIPGVRT